MQITIDMQARRGGWRYAEIRIDQLIAVAATADPRRRSRIGKDE